jgi:hypothetical protein
VTKRTGGKLKGVGRNSDSVFRHVCVRLGAIRWRYCALRFAGDLPDGLIFEMAVQPHFKKYFLSRLTQITPYRQPSRPSEGRIMIVTDVGTGCGGRGSVGAWT